MEGKFIHDARGEFYDLGELSSIGRSTDSVVPVADPRVSRRHAVIRRQDDGFWFFDLGSSNGSYLNGRRVTTAQLLKNGDIVMIGNHQLRFEGSLLSANDSSHTESVQTLIGVQSKDALILVSDIQGFTSLSEQLSPDELAPIMGSWYAAISLVLDEHGATLDKFIGDCVLAYWLNTSTPARLAALQAAWAMQRVADEVQRNHREALARADLTFKTGAAIHLGPVAYGAISAGEFTLLGDAVNLAFRLESLTREFDKPVLVSGEFLTGWEIGQTLCDPCGSHQVKGRTEPVEVYTVERAPD
ncbi:MAG: adenylate cyclase [Verrucomicrobiales bacterium]|jgi:adenylate cyclase